MSKESLYLLLAGVGYLVIFVSGYLMHGKEKPYNTLLLSVHKLISLGLGVVLILMAVAESKAKGLSASSATWLGIALFLLLDTIVSGGLVSVKKEMPKVIKTIHRILPYATLAAGGLFFYFSIFA